MRAREMPPTNDVRLRIHLIWILLFSTALAAGGVSFGVPIVGPLELGISIVFVIAVVWLLVREVCGLVHGNVFGGPSGRPSKYMGSLSKYLWLFILLPLLDYVFGGRLEQLLLGYRSLVQLAFIAFSMSFFFAAVVTFGWLVVYERRHGPVYIAKT